MSLIPSKSKLDGYVKMGLIRSQTHPTLPLTIYVYTEQVSFERIWNSVTMACRGLVVDDKSRCVVRCIPKFFNDNEPHALCDMPKDELGIAFNKLDGSLIQIVNDREYGMVVTSKGSFTSDQAVWGKQIVERDSLKFEQGFTYVFELIHPENRIVLDYGDTKELYLLAVVETETGIERNIYADKYDSFKRVEMVLDTDKHMSGLVEGIVVKTGSHRYKVKTGEYLRLHRIVTEFTPKRVWEALKDGDNLEFENMPEEFQSWLDETIAELETEYTRIYDEAVEEHTWSAELTDKDVGLNKTMKYKGIVFMLRNGEDPEQIIWKLLKPNKEIYEDNSKR